MIQNENFDQTLSSIIKQENINKPLLNLYIQLGIIKQKQNSYVFACPIFIQKDLSLLKQLSFQIANEIYHIIFGTVNELLIREGIVCTPDEFESEGRYCKAFTIY